MELERREQEILAILLNNKWITISHIAKSMSLSNKTISQSLKIIDQFLEGSEVTLIRKPKVGISLLGNVSEIQTLIGTTQSQMIPTTKEERVQYLCFIILKKANYFTRQDLQDSLYISKTTLEKDMKAVSDIFSLFHVTIEWIPGKGSFLNLTEQEKRKLVVDLIYYFWGHNWQVVKTDQSVTHTIRELPQFARKFVNLTMLQEIDELVQEYLLKAQYQLTDMSYHSLLLHLLIAIERIKAGRFLQKECPPKTVAMKPEFVQFIERIETQFAIHLSASEIRFIKSYLLIDDDQRVDSNMNHKDEWLIREMIQETILDYDEASLLGLVTHIKALIKRLRNGLSVMNPFISDVKQSFPISFEEGIRLKKKLEKLFALSISEDEVAFLAVHIQAFKERNKEGYVDKVNVLLVCSSGKGTSQLLAARIRREFPKLNVTRILSIQELAKTNVVEELILSTVRLTIKNQPILYVSPVLNQTDQEKIAHFLLEKEQLITRNHEFSKLIQPDLILLDKTLYTIEEVFRFIGEKLLIYHYAKRGIIESATEREYLSFTSFGKFATPHGASEFIEKSTLVFLRLKEEIKWGEEKVKYVFFICIKDETPEELELIYDNLLEIIENGDKKYLAKGTKEQLLSYLREGK